MLRGHYWAERPKKKHALGAIYGYWAAIKVNEMIARKQELLI